MSRELYYVEDGSKKDASLHSAMLDPDDRRPELINHSRDAARRSGLTDDQVAELYP